jgi:curved DNA-binding protein CbpA
LAEAKRGSDNLDEPDYYQILGVPYSATHAEITRAYRTAIKLVHPDRQSPARRGAAEERAKLLNRAFSTLSKPELRRHYDQRIRAQVVQDQIMSRYVGGFSTPNSGPSGQSFRRPPTAAERRDREQADRGALISIVFIFGGIAIGVVILLVAWAIAGAVWNAVF